MLNKNARRLSAANRATVGDHGDMTPVQPEPSQPPQDHDAHAHAVAAAVDETLRPVGYFWPGGVVLTDREDPRVQKVIEANQGYGIGAGDLGWVSLISPSGGLILDDDVPLEPQPKTWGTWQHLHGCTDGTLMGVIATDSHGRVVGAAGTARRSDLTGPLTMAVLRTLEDSDDIPESAAKKVAPGNVAWADGWALDRNSLLAATEVAHI